MALPRDRLMAHALARNSFEASFAETEVSFAETEASFAETEASFAETEAKQRWIAQLDAAFDAVR